MHYNNFGIVIYCPVQNLIDIHDIKKFEKAFSFIEKHVKINKVYLETYRGGITIDRDKMKKLIDFFKGRGIKTSGGITTDTVPDGEGGFDPMCYSDAGTRDLLSGVVSFTASLFDEIILDDFFFTNCKCPRCIEYKGNRSWAEFRIDLMKEISENVIVGPAKRVNPNINMIIKYPNWYEHYQECGYNIEQEPHIFDSVYTGTETRNPTYTQQHLPKYNSYFLFRYLENIAPGRNLGGWFDPYECSYSLTSYADQAYLTLMAKAPEATMFSLGSLLEPEYSLFPPVAGQVFLDMDDVLGKLGDPSGIACYLPYHSRGEDYLHGYIGMLGIPLEPYAEYPEGSKTIFLTEGAAKDKNIIEKVKSSLLAGADVIVTSGFVKATGESFRQIASIIYSDRKAIVDKYAYSNDGGICFGGYVAGSGNIVIPQLEHPTNDVWEIAGAFGQDNSFPVFLKTLYGDGHLFVLTIPDDFGNLYKVPKEVLLPVRQAFCDNTGIVLDGPAQVALFIYDNDIFSIRSFLPYYDRAELIVKKEGVVLHDIRSGRIIEGEYSAGNSLFKLNLTPGIYRFYKLLTNRFT